LNKAKGENALHHPTERGGRRKSVLTLPEPTTATKKKGISPKKENKKEEIYRF
jgi:hypothetical protein